MKRIVVLLTALLMSGCLSIPEGITPVKNFELDKQNYDYAFVSGPNLDYLWLLSRNKTVPPAVKARFLEKAKQAGFATEQLIFVKQD